MTSTAEQQSTIAISRHMNADAFNKVVNHPEVLPHVGPNGGSVDMGPVVSNPKNIMLMSEHGGILFVMLQQGLYDAHMAVVPEGWGDWARNLANEAARWLFTRTDAVEIVAHIPKDNLRVLGMARYMRMQPEFVRPAAWKKDGHPVSATVYSLSVQQWMRTAPGIQATGSAFSKNVRKTIQKSGGTVTRIPDDIRDRYTGASLEMILGGQPIKGIVLFNRWAVTCGYTPAAALSASPLSINLGGDLIMVRDGTYWVLPCLQQ